MRTEEGHDLEHIVDVNDAVSNNIEDIGRAAKDFQKVHNVVDVHDICKAVF